MKFNASKVFFGGVIPFKVETKKAWIDSSLDTSEFLDIKKSMHDFNLSWIESNHCSKFERKILGITSSQGKKENIKLTVFISEYNSGFGSLQFWFDTSKEEFSLQELIDIGRLISEDYDPVKHKRKSSFESRDGALSYSFKSYLLKEIIANSEDLKLGNPYPIISVGQIEHCQDKEQLIQNFSSEIIGLCELWGLGAKSTFVDKGNQIITND